MQVLKLKPGSPIPNPADPLGPPLAFVADVRGGVASIVVRDHPDDDADGMLAFARRLVLERQVWHRKYKRP